MERKRWRERGGEKRRGKGGTALWALVNCKLACCCSGELFTSSESEREEREKRDTPSK